jgi:hypothetical protein
LNEGENCGLNGGWPKSGWPGLMRANYSTVRPGGFDDCMHDCVLRAAWRLVMRRAVREPAAGERTSGEGKAAQVGPGIPWILHPDPLCAPRWGGCCVVMDGRALTAGQSIRGPEPCAHLARRRTTWTDDSRGVACFGRAPSRPRLVCCSRSVSTDENRTNAR